VDASAWDLPTGPVMNLNNNPEKETGEQRAVREQRDAAMVTVRRLMKSKEDGGQNLTFAKMPAAVKIDVCNKMALYPAGWPPGVTIRRFESKVSSDRSNGNKRVSA
jgi:hypothetical protein